MCGNLYTLAFINNHYTNSFTVTIKENGHNSVRLSPIIGGAVGALVLLITVVIVIVALLRYAKKG